MYKYIKIFLFVAVVIVFWQFGETHLSNLRQLDGHTGLEAFIPTPVSIYQTFVNQGGLIVYELSHTLYRALIGIIIGILFAFLVSVFFALSKSLRELLFPVSFALNSFPIVGFAPLIILIFGQGSNMAIIFISALVCYFPVLVALDSAFENTDRELLNFIKVLNASKIQMLFKVQIPLAVPNFMMSLKLAIPASIIGATLGEWLGTRNGIGQLITVSLYQLKPSLLYASLISVTATCFLVLFIISFLQKFLLKWKNLQ